MFAEPRTCSTTSAGEGGWRVGIIDCAEDLNRSGANALLKLIEEPPPRSLFLIVAHRPAHVLPTIRSRCRMLTLQPLAPADIDARSSTRSANPGRACQRCRSPAAAERAGGSVRDALRLLDGAGSRSTTQIDALLGRLPAVDWRGVHALAEADRRPRPDFRMRPG